MNTNTLSGHSNNSQRRGHSLAFVFLTLWASLFSFAGAAYPAPEIAINSVAVNEAAGSATFTVTLSEPGDTAIKVDYATVGNTASGGSDFSPASGTLNWPTGNNAPQLVVVTILNDGTVEESETFSVQLSNATGSNLSGDASITVTDGIGTITNDDSYGVSIANASAAEGAAVSFTITLGAARSMPVTVNYATADGTATAADNDYTSTSSSITIPAGPAGQTASFTVPSTADANVEPNETFTVTLSSADPNASMPAGPATGTITNDDAYVLSVNDVSIAEGNSGTKTATFTISISQSGSVPISVDYATSSGTATQGTDFVAATGQATITAGSTSTTFNVTINGDTSVEADETFNVTLSNIVGPGTFTGGDSAGVGTITNDDAYVLSVNDVSIAEGNSGTKTATFTISISQSGSVPISVDYATSSGTATQGTDFVAAAGQATITAGSTSTTFNVTINGDTSVEADETFNVTLSNMVGPGTFTGGDSAGIGTITNDDAYAVSIANGSAAEGTPVTFTITLSAARSIPVIVTATLADGTATLADSDYTNASGPITIPAGAAGQTYPFSVPTTADTKVEANETFTVTLSSTDPNATMPAGPATGTITNNDSCAVSIANASAAEGTPVSFTITLGAARTMPVTINYATADGTATVADNDYTSTSGSMIIPAGPAGQTVSFPVPTTADAKVEPNETFTVTLSSADPNATMPAGPATGTITNNDSYAVTIANGSATEGTPVSFTITLGAVRTMPVTINYVTANGTATVADNDYTFTSSSITIPAGSAGQTASFTIATTADTKVEANETFTVTLSSADPNATMPAGPATGTITNNDSYAVSIANASATEGTAVTFILTLNAARSMPVTVNYVTADGTATVADNDYTSTSSSRIIPAGPAGQTASFTIATTADTKVEPNETFTITLSSADPNAVMPAGPATGTITNNDTNGVTIPNASASEGTPVTFTLAMGAARTMSVTINYATADGTATVADNDYTSTSSSITIPAGPAGQTASFSVPTTADTKVEPNETFTVTLTSTDPNVILPAGPATGTIINNDSYGVSIANASATEGTAVTFTITLNAARSMPVDLTATVADGTATLADSDYTNVSGLITIPAGAAGQTHPFSVPTIPDFQAEPNETFTVTLTSTDPNATMPGAPATGTITNNDYRLTVSKIGAAADGACSITASVGSVSGAGGGSGLNFFADYENGDVVTLTVTDTYPLAGSIFKGWGGSIGGSAYTTTVMMDGTKTVTANFNATYTFNIDKDGTGAGHATVTSGTGSNSALFPGGTASGTYLYELGDVVTLTGTDNMPTAAIPGSEFQTWFVAYGVAGGSFNSGSKNTSVTITGDLSITGNFIGKYMITSIARTGGSITPLGAVIKYHGQSQPYTITANASFVNSDVVVDGVSQGAQPLYTFESLSNNHTIIAVFQAGSEVFTGQPAGDEQIYMTNVPPMVLLVMGRDHKLYNEAYNDASDLNGDGALDVGYNHEIDYYGYFDSHKVYKYDSVNKRFYPDRVTSNKKVNPNAIDEWSGDFLNYLTMSRIDTLRKVLYGGYRYVDTQTETVLMRSYIPQDAHSWGKEYESIERDGYDIREYTPLDLPAARTRHLFANTTLKNPSTLTEPDLNRPLLRVLNDSYYRIWEWVSIGKPVAGTKCLDGTSGPDCARAATTAGDHPGHPDDSFEFQDLINLYAVSGKLIGSEPVTQINGSGNPFGASDNYLSIFTGQINIASAGKYRFAVDGDDAVELLIDGLVRIGYYGPHPACVCTSNNSALIYLSAGPHTVEFRHEDGGGPDNYYLYWKGPDSGNNWQIIPAAKYSNLTMTTYSLLTEETPASAMTDYEVKVLVGTSSLPENNCKKYPNGTYKPTGLLQKFGEPGKLIFGLMTGSYEKNTSGGVLRKTIQPINDEIDANTGRFKHKYNSAFKGIIQTIDAFRVTGFDYQYHVYGNNKGQGSYVTTRAMQEGEFPPWANPIGEMMYEGLRYFSGVATPTSQYIYTNTAAVDNTLGLPVATWDDPFADPERLCAKAFLLVLSDINPNYDSDQLPGVNSAFAVSNFNDTFSSKDATPVAFNAQSLADSISSAEGGLSDHYIGQLNTSFDSSCKSKNLSGNGFGHIRGLCPEEPTKEGSYYSAGAAYFGRSQDIHTAASKQEVLTYAVGLASPLPRIEIPVGNSVVTLVPFAKSIKGLNISPNEGQFQPTNTIVDFYVESLRPAAGTFRVNYSELEQAGDYDMDSIVIYFYQVTDDDGNPVANPEAGTQVKISLLSESAESQTVQHFGYIISGTTADGTYLEVRDADTPAEVTSAGDADYFLDTPPGVTPPATQAQWENFQPLPLVSERFFTPGMTTAATLLQTPLWYAAKWGGFVDQNENNMPDLQSEFDADGDGVPDTYFYVVNPLKLEQQLTRTFADILSRGVSHVAPVVSVDEANRTQSGDKLYMAFFKPMYDTYWKGNLKKYGLDFRIRDDCGRIYPEWTVVDQFVDDSSSAATSGHCDGTFLDGSRSFWSAEADGGYVDKGGVGARLKDRMPGESSSKVPTAPYYEWRNIYTYINGINGALDRFIPTNANITKELLAVSTDMTKFRIMNFIYGYTYDATSDTDSTPLSKRDWLLGDIIHSEPKIIDYFDENDNLTRRFVAVGANDGMLHVFTDSDLTIGTNSYAAGDEVFAFIPGDLLPRLQEFGDPQTHRYTVDGSPALYRSQTKTDGTNYDQTLIFGERSGGRNYWALDISNPDPAQWKVKWHIQGGPGGTPGFEELGYTWSKPFITRLKTGTSTTKEAVIFAGGYDTMEDGFPEGFDDQNKNGKRDVSEPHGVTVGGTEGYDKWNPGMDTMGRGIFVLDLSNASILFKATYGDDDGNGNEAEDVTTGVEQKFAMMKYCIPADISVIPLSDSNIIMYVADVYGQLWRIRYDFVSGTGTWTVKRVFTANPGSTLASGDAAAFISGIQTLNAADAGRKMFYSPDVSLFGNDWTSQPLLYVGTGDRQHPRYTMISNRLYFVTDTGSVADETDLLNLTCNELDDDATVDPDTKAALRNILEAGSNSVRGFYRVLDQQGNCADDDIDHTGEHILSQPTLFYKNVYFTSYQPTFDDPCNPLGNAFIYALNFSWGTSAFNYDLSNDTTETDIRTLKDTYRRITGSSIPSGVRVIMRDGQAAGVISAGGAVAGVGEDGSTNIPGPPGGITPLLWETD